MECVYGLGVEPLVLPRADAPRDVTLIASTIVVDTPGVAIPRAEVHLAVRFGAAAQDGLDLHALGPRKRSHRKLLRGGMRALLARLPLGTPEAVFGVSGSALAERIVPLDALWGEDAHRLASQLHEARDLREAANLLETAIGARLRGVPMPAHTRLAVEAAKRLSTERVADVADALGVSERNLRRVFRDVVGMGPKEFAKLARFQRALHEARRQGKADWARIAASSGYFDQAHLIAEFRDVSGVTPRALLRELML